VNRTIGMCVISALLVSGTTVAIAGPSSAMPRDTCLDEQHYLEQDAWYQGAEFHALDIAMAWGAAAHEVNPVSGESWTANLPSGYETVFTQADYSARRTSAYNSWLHAQNATMDFEANYVPC
jgi:hypothetical protein